MIEVISYIPVSLSIWNKSSSRQTKKGLLSRRARSRFRVLCGGGSEEFSDLAFDPYKWSATLEQFEKKEQIRFRERSSVQFLIFLPLYRVESYFSWKIFYFLLFAKDTRKWNLIIYILLHHSDDRKRLNTNCVSTITNFLSFDYFALRNHSTGFHRSLWIN